MRALQSLRPLVAGLVVLTLLCLPGALRAQVGSTTDIIAGTVIGPNGQPLAGAQVEVFSLDLETTRSRATNDRGQYTILFPDGGGRYRVTVRALGMAPVSVQVIRQADEDRIIANVNMSANAVRLQGVVVQGRQAPRGGDRPEPGSVERTILSELAARLPIDASDLTALALLAPGVVATDGTDTTAAGFSVAGQRPDLNSVTLDGLSFGGTNVPQEAVRTTRVITNTYDVSRGQFSGGQVASTTRRGGNAPQGSVSYNLRDPSMEWLDDDETSFGQAYRQQQLSGGFGGPLLRNKLFAFGSVQLRRRTADLPTLLGAPGATLQRLGVAPDSVSRFVDQLQAYGLNPYGIGPLGDRQNDNLTFVGRVDYRLTDLHSLAFRTDLRYSGQGGSRIGTLSLPQAGGDSRTLAGGAMVTLTSQIGAGFLNELRAYGSGRACAARPIWSRPRVACASTPTWTTARRASARSASAGTAGCRRRATRSRSSSPTSSRGCPPAARTASSSAGS